MNVSTTSKYLLSLDFDLKTSDIMNVCVIGYLTSVNCAKCERIRDFRHILKECFSIVVERQLYYGKQTVIPNNIGVHDLFAFSIYEKARQPYKLHDYILNLLHNYIALCKYLYLLFDYFFIFETKHTQIKAQCTSCMSYKQDVIKLCCRFARRSVDVFLNVFNFFVSKPNK